MSAREFTVQEQHADGTVTPFWLTRSESAEGARLKAVSILQGERALTFVAAEQVIGLLIADGTFTVVLVREPLAPTMHGLGI